MARVGTLGILAYGSLIEDPGSEIGPLVVNEIDVLTPFPVEFARLSRGRGGGPTVVPYSVGRQVTARILVLADSVSVQQGSDILWRRETGRIGSRETYRAMSGPSAVIVRTIERLGGVERVLFTDFNPDGKVPNPTPEHLARAAIASVRNATPGRDGISYLMSLIRCGIETELTNAYTAEILKQTGTTSLQAAIDAAGLEGEGR